MTKDAYQKPMAGQSETPASPEQVALVGQEVGQFVTDLVAFAGTGLSTDALERFGSHLRGMTLDTGEAMLFAAAHETAARQPGECDPVQRLREAGGPKLLLRQEFGDRL